MLNCFVHESSQSIPIYAILAEQWSTWLTKQSTLTQDWLHNINFIPYSGNYSFIPNGTGELHHVLLVTQDETDFWTFGVLPSVLPGGHYHIEGIDGTQLLQIALVWGLGAYEFTRYKPSIRPVAQLLIPTQKFPSLKIKLEAIYRVRDLINTPADDMTPVELAENVFEIGKNYQAAVTQIVGDDLLTANYPAIYTVGKASCHEPRLIDLRWGDNQHPKITLVGKGVCFDSGGYNLKSSSAMLAMKKDMGGAANAMGLAEMIMAYQLPVRLRLLIPAVENMISGGAYKPGDIIQTRHGLAVEVGNTDAEGRLILADALCEADSESPELLIDFATLTGAARSAVGTEISAFFTDHEQLAQDIIRHSQHEQDPVWRLPLYKPYQKLLESKFAHLNNCGASPFAGAITAALFLRSFISEETTWLHFDFNAYNVNTRPGRPEGGEAMAILAVFSYLLERYPFQTKQLPHKNKVI
ncbi:leucyl aminopeptidase family protein [Rickettsiella grylli]|uniref:Cytosol aminopeptidase family protein n=1 Tax=Rickettsiella grylli TaxID=59196 RepID=A8PNJ7_9COXI|nr:leucyl aminopeptidase family protein [Rickettsiella grylli]EDP46363.1 cytosol aminopeptidase family protein [Rickettsiella grylli]